MKVRDRRDGCVHYSALRHMKQSPAHYRHYCETPFEPTPAMLLGTLVHVELFGHQPGRTIAVWEGKRRLQRSRRSSRRTSEQVVLEKTGEVRLQRSRRSSRRTRSVLRNDAAARPCEASTEPSFFTTDKRRCARQASRRRVASTEPSFFTTDKPSSP